jgi:hypothetical protein
MKRLAAHRVLALVFGAFALAMFAIGRSWSEPLGRDFAFWSMACIVGEVLVVRLPMGRATNSFASCMHFAVLLLLPRGQAMAMVGLTGAFAEAVFLRKPPLRVLFNASQASIAVGAASLVYAMLGGGRASVSSLLYGFELLPFAGAAAVYYVINTGAVSLAVALSEGVSPWSAWRRNFGTRYQLLGVGGLISLGALLASHYAVTGAGGTLIVLLPLLLVHEGYRHYSKARLEAPGPSEAERDAA